jgi:RND family efflux transporter MFP subunit
MLTILLVPFISLTFQQASVGFNKAFVFIGQDQTGIRFTELAREAPVNSKKAGGSRIGKASFSPEENIGGAKSRNLIPENAVITAPLIVNCFGILWLGGFIFVLVKLSYSLVFLKGFKAATLTEPEEKFLTILLEVSEVFHFERVPQVFVSQAVASPITAGIFKKSVFIPAGLYKNMTEDEFRSILYHEFAHIFHKDHFFSIIDKLIIGINWWNPLVYYISTEQNTAREEICDEYAIRGVKSAQVYSTCLVNLAEKVCLISNFPAAAGMAGKKSGLEKRIKLILSEERKMFCAMKQSVKLATVVVCALTVCIVGAASVSSVEEPKKTQKTVLAVAKRPEDVKSGITRYSRDKHVSIRAKVTVIPALVDSQVIKYHFKESEKFPVGKILASLDKTAYKQRLIEKNAALEEAKANLEFTKKGAKRAKDLHEKGVLGETELASAERDAKIAEARYLSAGASRDVAQRKLALCDISAPFSGKLVQKLVNEHEYVRTGQPLMKIINDNQLWAVSYVSPRDRKKMKLGQKVTIKVDPAGTFHEGEIYEISDQTATPTRGFVMKILIDNKDGALSTGMSGVLVED